MDVDSNFSRHMILALENRDSAEPFLFLCRIGFKMFCILVYVCLFPVCLMRHVACFK